MTQQNAAMVEETNAATKNLTQEASQLSKAFASFKIGEDQNRGMIGNKAFDGHRAPGGRAKAAGNVLDLRVQTQAPAPLPRPTQITYGNLAEKDDWSEF